MFTGRSQTCVKRALGWQCLPLCGGNCRRWIGDWADSRGQINHISTVKPFSGHIDIAAMRAVPYLSHDALVSLNSGAKTPETLISPVRSPSQLVSFG